LEGEDRSFHGNAEKPSISRETCLQRCNRHETLAARIMADRTERTALILFCHFEGFPCGSIPQREPFFFTVPAPLRQNHQQTEKERSQVKMEEQAKSKAGKNLQEQEGEKKGSGKKIIVGVILIAALLAVLLCVYRKFGPKTQTGTKAYTVEVVDNNGDKKSYQGKTDAEYLSGLMDELTAEGDFSYEGTQSDYGLYITTINGVTADYDKDKAYWSIYVNGEVGQYGADSQPVADGDDFQFVYEKGQ